MSRAGRRGGCGVGRAALIALCIVAPRGAGAGGLDFDLVGARAIGRAGATTVSGDGGAALATNPSGIARSASFRIQLGLALHDDDMKFRSLDGEALGSPTIVDRSTPSATPNLAVAGSLGPIVLGAALLELGRFDRSLPAPSFGQVDAMPADDDEETGENQVRRLFPHRYGGLAAGYRRRLAVVGAAVRARDWLGVGISAGIADVEVTERRHVWAGFDGRDTLGTPLRDLDLRLSAADRMVPFAAGGLLIAPTDLPLELGAGISWSADARMEGDADLLRISAGMFPAPKRADIVPTSSLRLAMPTTVRAGVRYLGDRFLVELGGELTLFRGGAPSWRTGGLAVEDQTGATGELARVPSLLAQRDHGALRGAVDIEVLPGLFWFTAGYAYATAATGRSHLAPAFGDLAGHTVSLGGEATWDRLTFTLGIARRLAPSVTVAGDESAVGMLNPFEEGGTATAGAGRHGRSHDAVGLNVELTWE